MQSGKSLRKWRYLNGTRPPILFWTAFFSSIFNVHYDPNSWNTIFKLFRYLLAHTLSNRQILNNLHCALHLQCSNSFLFYFFVMLLQRNCTFTTDNSIAFKHLPTTHNNNNKFNDFVFFFILFILISLS